MSDNNNHKPNTDNGPELTSLISNAIENKKILEQGHAEPEGKVWDDSAIEGLNKEPAQEAVKRKPVKPSGEQVQQKPAGAKPVNGQRPANSQKAANGQRHGKGRPAGQRPAGKSSAPGSQSPDGGGSAGRPRQKSRVLPFYAVQ